MSQHRIRFYVDGAQATHTLSYLDTVECSVRRLYDNLLTEVVCPHTRVLGRGVAERLREHKVGKAESKQMSMLWPQSLVKAMDPSLALADLSLTDLLTLTWSWAHAPGGKIALPLACRLAAWGSYWTNENKEWDYFLDKGVRGQPAAPHDLWTPPATDPEQLPWNTRLRGYK